MSSTINSTPKLNSAAKSKASWRDQFAHPTGWSGSLFGFLMAIKNQVRSRWVISQLELQPEDRVLEIGFGPGTDVQRISKLVPRGFVAGLDLSEVMVRQASRRNRLAVQAGQVALRQGSIADPLPYGDNSFSKIFSINSFQFWEKSVESLKELHRVLQPDGLIALAVQPMNKGATDDTAHEIGQRLVAHLSEAGFKEVKLQVQSMKPVAVACAFGKK